MSATHISGKRLFVALSAVGVYGGIPDPDVVDVTPEIAERVLAGYFGGITPHDPEEVYYQMDTDGLRDGIARSERWRRKMVPISWVMERYIAPFAMYQQTVDAFTRLFRDIATGKLPVSVFYGQTCPN